jgi:hypothetical protein
VDEEEGAARAGDVDQTHAIEGAAAAAVGCMHCAGVGEEDVTVVGVTASVTPGGVTTSDTPVQTAAMGSNISTPTNAAVTNEATPGPSETLLWSAKYAPLCAGQVCGNAAAASSLKEFLQDWREVISSNKLAAAAAAAAAGGGGKGGREEAGGGHGVSGAAVAARAADKGVADGQGTQGRRVVEPSESESSWFQSCSFHGEEGSRESWGVEQGVSR